MSEALPGCKSLMALRRFPHGSMIRLVAYGGLEPVVRLAERCGLGELAGELVRLPKSKDGMGAFVAAKLMTLVAGMVAGADSIDDMDRPRAGGGAGAFRGGPAPPPPGSLSRC